MNIKNIIYIIVALIIVILISLYIGKSIGIKDNKDKDIKNKIQYIQIENKENYKKIDSLNNIIKSLNKKDISFKKQEIIKRKESDKIEIKKPTNNDCIGLYDSATVKINMLNDIIDIKDSIETNLRKTIEEKDRIIETKDKIIANKDIEINLQKELSKKRDKKYTVGIQLGTGGAIIKNPNNITVNYVPIYVGIGISKKIFSF